MAEEERLLNLTTRCVFKLGGSLLSQPDWPTRLRAWLDQQPSGQYYGVVGGGDVIEAMRKLDGLYRLSQRDMHWRCIRLLDATLEIAAELMPEFDVIQELSELDSTDQANQNLMPTTERQAFWVRVGGFYSEKSLQDRASLAETWETTTDALAIYLAEKLRASRCVLMKSCQTESVKSLEEAVDLGIVDRGSLRFRELFPQVELHTL